VTTVSLHDPQTLYRPREEQQWSPFAIDLVADARQWQTMGGEERDLVLWALSSLMVAEEQFITRYLSGRGCSPDSSSATPRSTTTSIATSATAPVPADGGGRGHHTWGRVRQTLRDLLPAVAASLAPPDRGDDTAGTHPAPAPTRYAPSPSTG
jgi:hypothetical protein